MSVTRSNRDYDLPAIRDDPSASTERRNTANDLGPQQRPQELDATGALVVPSSSNWCARRECRRSNVLRCCGSRPLGLCNATSEQLGVTPDGTGESLNELMHFLGESRSG